MNEHEKKPLKEKKTKSTVNKPPKPKTVKEKVSGKKPEVIKIEEIKAETVVPEESHKEPENENYIPKKSDITWKGITQDIWPKMKHFFETMWAGIKDIFIRFTKLEVVVQLCIIIPLAILLIILGNNIYTKHNTTYLKCRYTSESVTTKIDQELVFTFKKEGLYKQTVTTTYKIVDSKYKTLGELETEKKKSNEDLEKHVGVKTSYKIKDDQLVNTVTYNFFKMSSDDINELGLDSKGTAETITEYYKVFGYTCEAEA